MNNLQFLLISFLFKFSLSCPIWRCSNKDDIEVPGYCYYEDNGQIVAGPWCVQNSKGCSIVDYFNGAQTLRCPQLPGADVYEGAGDIDSILGKEQQWEEIIAEAKAADANAAAAAEAEQGINEGARILNQRDLKTVEHILAVSLKNKICLGKDLWHLYQCDNFCENKQECNKRSLESEGRQLAEQVCFECDWQGYKESMLHKREGYQGWRKCDYNNECSSGDCDCVISTDQQGRCTTSVYEEIYEDFWQYLCEETHQHDYEDIVCEKYISVNMGHYLRAITEAEGQLSCLHKFGDILELQDLLKEVKEKSGGSAFLIIIIIILIAICGCGGFYFYKKNQKDEVLRDQPETHSGQQFQQRQDPYAQYHA